MDSDSGCAILLRPARSRDVSNRKTKTWWLTKAQVLTLERATYLKLRPSEAALACAFLGRTKLHHAQHAQLSRKRRPQNARYGQKGCHIRWLDKSFVIEQGAGFGSGLNFPVVSAMAIPEVILLDHASSEYHQD